MMEIALSLVVILLLACILPVGEMWDSVKLLIDRSTRPGFKYKSASIRSEYPAVSIRAATGCCRGVQMIEGKRYFSPEAPQLPLPECSSDQCRCSYFYHQERRWGTPRQPQVLAAHQAALSPSANNGKRRGKAQSLASA